MKTLFASVVLCTTVLAGLVDEKEQELLERGRKCCEQFRAGEVQVLWDQFDETMRGALGSLDKLKAFREQASSQLGAELSLVEELAQPGGPAASYIRRSRFEKVPVVIETRFAFDAEQKISSFVVQPVRKEAPSEFLEYQTKTRLELPFEGEWSVFWGGRTLAQNYHAATEDQRFAYDIMILRDGSSHAGDGKRNEDYHCFGKPILAPGAGVVLVAVDGIEDNVPGEMNPRQPPGNHVILDHGNGEYSLIAHFRKGTLKVKPGDKIELGQQLAECGNSGNSSEPHLHYHLQNTPKFHDAKGLPVQFQSYVADDKDVERGEPVKGQRIRKR